MTATQSSEPVVINLAQDEIELANNRSKDAALQRDGWTDLETLINTHIKVIEASQEKPLIDTLETAISYPRQHKAVLIEGGRGSGKTTFTLNFLQYLKQPTTTTKENSLPKVNVLQVHVLPMVDPTLIETKDNVIILLLQMIEAAIDEKTRTSRPNENDLNELEKARGELAEGLRLLDGIGQKEAYGSEWEDATWVMREGLHRAKKGRSFEVKLNIYIEKALKVLGKKIFVLAFDDVDTKFTLGYDILETIRKYLTSPRLAILISGDIDLYGRLLRRKIYENFGSDLVRHDEAAKIDTRTAVRELEEQYLLKVLPPQNRIKMLPLSGLGRDIKVVLVQKGEPTELKEWASKQIRALLGESESSKPHPFLRVILTEHLRLAIGYLRALNFEARKEKGRSDVLKVFEARLRAANVSTELLDANNIDFALRAACDWIAEQEEPASLISSDGPRAEDQAIVLHCLMLAIAGGLDQSGVGLKTLFVFALPTVMLKRPQLSLPAARKQVFAYLSRQATPFLPDIAARISVIGRGQQNVAKASASSFGSVGLAGKTSISLSDAIKRVYGVNHTVGMTIEGLLKEKTDRQAFRWLEQMKKIDDSRVTTINCRFGTAWFTIDDIIDKKRCGKFGDILKLIFFQRFSARGEAFRSISALSLLAVIGELLANEVFPDLMDLRVDTIIPAFGSESQDMEGIDSQGEEDALETDGADTSPTSTYDTFYKNLQGWHTFARARAADATLAPAQIMAFAARLHDDLLALDEEVRAPWGSGKILHRQITNILNAALVITTESLSRKESPKTSDQPLTTALSNWSRKESPKTSDQPSTTAPQDKTLHAFAAILLSCPLIWIFLDPQSDPKTGLKGKVIEALQNYDDSMSEKFVDWTKQPKIGVKISKIVDDTYQRTVMIDGFYDLLNVVPRYSEQSKASTSKQESSAGQSRNAPTA